MTYSESPYLDYQLTLPCSNSIACFFSDHRLPINSYHDHCKAWLGSCTHAKLPFSEINPQSFGLRIRRNVHANMVVDDLKSVSHPKPSTESAL